MSEQSNPIRDAIAQAIDDNRVILFMKGTPDQPMCGFSARTSAAIQSLGVQFAAVDILPDPRIRQELSALSNWPTIPQLFVRGELVGGCDIVTEMYETGELAQVIGVEAPADAPDQAPVGAEPGAPPLTIENNLFDDINQQKWKGPGIFLLLVSDPPPAGYAASGIPDLVIDHNTAFHTGSTASIDAPASPRFVFSNNIVANNTYGFKGSDSSTGIPTLQTFFPGYWFKRNAIVGGKASLYPADNFFPATYDAVGFVDRAGGNYRLAPSSLYKGAGEGGTDVGADIDALTAAIGS